ncbi:unnamed protein product [Cylindrotheca closterium]|uniref:Glycosyl hydrolase family 30 TIM-barrel domain-containing protein n=1 Tax=Cylindrotheca closterium TaxID=2856 RepID=A0AAD2JG73_9STRA|nr:unnamed protein product [Cylindrotheca closterium]
MSPPMGETQPLIYHGKNGQAPETMENETKEKSTCSSGVAKLVIVALLAIIGTHLYDRHFNATDKVVENSSDLPPPPELPSAAEENSETSEDASASTTTAPLQYRPYCMTYHNQKTARILQTSMGSPSQQWSRIPCYAEPEKVRKWAKSPTPPDAHVNEYGNPDAILNISLNDASFADRKPILGFGAAFTEAASLNYQSLSEKGKETLMELYFGKSGLGYALGRVHINSCDFSVKSYSFDDVDGDFELEQFDTNATHDNQKDGMMDMIRRATSVFERAWKPAAEVEGEEIDPTRLKDGNLLMYASPWSPPAWMKNPIYDVDPENATHAAGMTGSTTPSCLREGTGKDSRYAKAWALYFSKFITTYREHGIDLWGITVQNEPEFPAPWEACAYTPEAQADFVAYHLGPQLEKDHPDIKVLMFDHNKDHMITWAKLLLNETAHPSYKYIDGTAYHWYAGGMDRLLDGAVGSPNLHRFQSTLKDLFETKTTEQDVNDTLPNETIATVAPNQGKEHIILGSEACHCPYTGYAGGSIEVYWARAERYVHTILADLAAGSNGWVEWNLVLDSVGGPNHLNNLCDTGILAVPHRAIVNGSEADIPPTLPFEKTKHQFGVNVGDTRTRAELNALGFPAKYLDTGLAVQPIYYYMGHISRYVRPGSRALSGLIQESKASEESSPLTTPNRAFRSQGQVVPGGGFNDLARNGIEVTAWPCEGSTRQVFEFDEDTKRIKVLGHDWLGKPTKSCLAKEADMSFKGITLTDCKKKLAATFDMVPIDSASNSTWVQFVQTNVPETSKRVDRCLVLGHLGNDGGALGPRGGAPVKYGSCAGGQSKWKYSDPSGGEIITTVLDAGEVCMTTGWPFLQMGAFSTPNGESESTVVLLNEARDSANYVLYDGGDVVLSGSIPPRSIQTVLLDSN